MISSKWRGLGSSLIAVIALGVASSAAAQVGADPASSFVPTEFEVIQLEERSVIVGTSEPGATIELLDGNIVVATAEANELGEWIAEPVQLGAGTVDLAVRTTSADGRFQVISEEWATVTFAASAATERDPPTDPVANEMTADDFQVTITTSIGAGVAAAVILSAPPTVTVRHGDTLWDIAERIYGTGVLYSLILEANRSSITSVRAIQPGQVLVVPPLAGR